MFAEFSKKITNELMKEKLIAYDNQEIYQFGIEQMLLFLLNITSVIVIGAFMNEILQCILFTVTFAVLRSYSGGCHASTPIRCYLYSMLSVIAVLSVMKLIKMNHFICIGLFILSGVVILRCSPVAAVNKPLDDLEYAVYRKKAVFIWCVEISVAMICMLLKFDVVSECIMMAHVLLSVALMIGRGQVERREK